MNTQRTQFIHRISRCLGRKAIPNQASHLDLPHDVQNDYLKGASALQIKAVFIKSAEAAGTTVYDCDPSSLNDTLLKAIHQLAEGAILLSDDPLWKEQHTADALKKVHADVHTWDLGKSRQNNIDIAGAAAVGIAVAQMALAETGTVMVYSHKGCGRSVTLLPLTTIFIIQKENIFPRLTQSMKHLQQQSKTELPSSINFISGASSTSDIELVRVQGVHGPVKIAYIIY